jgi:acyl-CoA dehydrogenase
VVLPSSYGVLDNSLRDTGPVLSQEGSDATMDFSYTPRMAEVRRTAQDLVGVIVNYENECERNNGLGRDAHRAIREAVLASGLQAINVPVQWGGAGLTVLEQVVVSETLGSLTNALWDTVWRPANPLLACSPQQRQKYLIPAARGERRDAVAITEETAGSDLSAVRTLATPDGDGYRISGNKWFVTVGDVADFLIVLAVAGPENAPTLFLVDTDAPGVSIVRTPRYTHTFVYEHPEFAFDNVPVGADAVLGTVGQGYELTRDWFTEERLMIAARTIGAADRALALAADWAANRIQGGEPLLDRQLIRGMISDSVVDIAVNRTFTHQVAWEFDQGGDRKTLHARAAAAKLAASEASNRVADRAVQIFGGRGYMRDYPVERIWRELRVDRIWEGTSEIQRLIIANEVAKRGLHGLLRFAGQD